MPVQSRPSPCLNSWHKLAFGQMRSWACPAGTADSGAAEKPVPVSSKISAAALSGEMHLGLNAGIWARQSRWAARCLGTCPQRSWRMRNAVGLRGPLSASKETDFRTCGGLCGVAGCRKSDRC